MCRRDTTDGDDDAVYADGGGDRDYHGHAGTTVEWPSIPCKNFP